MAYVKNALNQVQFTVVDGTDGLSIESGITKSALSAAGTFRLIQTANQVSTAASVVTPSKAVSLVRSGVFKQTLRADECNFDNLMLSIEHASIAHQLIPISLDTTESQFLVVSNYLSNASNYLSNISALAGNIDSQLLLTASAVNSQFAVTSNYLSNASNYLSNASNYLSNISAVLSDQTSNLQSILDSQFVYFSNVLSSIQSDMKSEFDAVTATVTASDISDIASRVWAEHWVAHSNVSSFGSAFSAMWTTVNAGASRALINQSLLSDTIEAKLTSEFAYLSNAISDLQSDMKSEFDNIATTLSTSDISNIASRVWGEKYDVHSAPSSFGSAFELLTSRMSQTQSQLDITHASMISMDSNLSAAISDMHSDIKSEFDGIGAITLSTSDISNIASRVWSEKWTDHSGISSFGSAFEVIMSGVSDLTSRVTAVVGTSSDLASKVWVDAAAASLISDATAIKSQLDVTDAAIDSLISNLQSDMKSEFDALVVNVTTSDISNIASRVWSEKWDIHSQPSSFGSAFEVLTSRMSQTQSQLDVTDASLANVDSALASQTVWISAFLSDIDSGMDSGVSDLSNQISGITVNVTTSDISNIASRVWAEAYGTHSLAASFGSGFSALWTATNAAASRALLNQSTVNSTAVALDSQFAYISNTLSDMQSDVTSILDSQFSYFSAVLSDFQSDMKSEFDGVGAATVTASDISNIASAVWAEHWANHSAVSSFGSFFSTVGTNATAAASRALLNQSTVNSTAAALDSQYALTSNYLSQIHSDLASAVSDARSDIVSVLDSQFVYFSNVLSDFQSDMKSEFDGVTIAQITTSDISNIASRVWAEAYGTHSLAASFGSAFSDMWTQATAAASRATLNNTAIAAVDSALASQTVWVSDFLSNIDSALASQTVWTSAVLSNLESDIKSEFDVVAATLSDFQSDMKSEFDVVATNQTANTSDIKSAVAAGPAATVTASDISNIASAVWAEHYVDHSAASSFGSLVSVAGTNAAAGASRALLNQSTVNSTAVALDSQFSHVSAALSDIQSDLGSAVSNALSDIRSVLDSQFAYTSAAISDLASDMKSEFDGVGAATVTASDISNIASAVWAEHYANHSAVSSFGSLVSVVGTNANAAASRATVIESDIATVSDAVSDLHSDFQSRVTGVVPTTSDSLVELSQAAPSATPTRDNALMLLYMAMRNKLTVTSSAKKVHNDAGTNITTKSLSDDGTTYTESEMGAGS